MRNQNARDVGSLTLNDRDLQRIDEADALERQLRETRPNRGAAGGVRVPPVLNFQPLLGVLLIFLALVVFKSVFVGIWRSVLSGVAQVETVKSRPSETIGITRLTVHLRVQPSIHSNTLGVIPVGYAVKVQERRTDGFWEITCGNVHGYALAAYIAPTEGVEPINNIPAQVAGISGKARLRESATMSSPAVDAVNGNSPVTIMGIAKNGWILVWTGNRAGFLWGGLFEPAANLPFQPCQQNNERVVILNGQTHRPA